jgi:hypothetical protein
MATVSIRDVRRRYGTTEVLDGGAFRPTRAVELTTKRDRP